MGCLADFMLNGCDYNLFIDSDIRWDPGDVLRMLMHIQHVEFICGIYFKHNDDPKPVVNFTPDWPNLPQEEIRGENGEVIARRVEIRNAGTGFMMFTRDVVKLMMEHHPELKTEFTMFRGAKDLSEQEKVRCEQLQEHYYNLFFPMMQDRGDTYPHHITEDYAFCERWREMGGKVWADPDVELTHMGMKAYKWKLSDLLKDEDG